MGANFQTVSFTPDITSPKQAQHAMSQRIEQCLHEYGHDAYNGTFSTCHTSVVLPRTFATDADAEAWIEEHHEKRDPVMIVKVTTPAPHYFAGAWCAE